MQKYLSGPIKNTRMPIKNGERDDCPKLALPTARVWPGARRHCVRPPPKPGPRAARGSPSRDHRDGGVLEAHLPVRGMASAEAAEVAYDGLGCQGGRGDGLQCGGRGWRG